MPLSLSPVGYYKFKFRSSTFLYDTTTNAIVPISRTVFAILDDFINLGENQVRDVYSDQLTVRQLDYAISAIRQMQSEGLLQPFARIQYAAGWDREKLQHLVETELTHITLDITEECNQRCMYCQLSTVRPHTHASAAVMSWDVAKKSIDYFLPRCSGKPQSPAAVCFYGGEPLLHWELVSRCIQYVRQCKALQPDSINIRIATNGTLLNSQMIDFLVKNDVVLQISLDGPQSIHNKKRVFANGSGTFERVSDVLKIIEEQYPDYYKKRVKLSTVVSLKNNIEEVFDFLSQPRFLPLTKILGRERAPDGSKLEVGLNSRKAFRSALDRLIKRHAEAMRTGGAFDYLLFRQLFRGEFGSLASRKIGPQNGSQFPNGACVPGVRRIFVTPDGSFHLCERFCSHDYPIGNSENGIVLDQAISLSDTFVKLCNSICQNCWAYRLCSQCYVHSVCDGEISPAAKAGNCDSERGSIAAQLRNFVAIWRSEPESVHSNIHSLHYEVLIRNR